MKNIEKRMITLYSIRWLPVALLLCGVSLSGRASDDQTEKEHRAVQRYVAARLASSARAVTPLSTPDQVTKWETGRLSKTEGTLAQEDRKSFLMNGNKITVRLYNYGGIGPGYNLTRGLDNVVWHNLDYVFQFCPFVGASVLSANDPVRRFHVISDGLWDYPGYKEISPTGDTLWAWQPLPGYADPDQSSMASNPADDTNGDGKPDSWPIAWYNPTLGKYVWPGYLSQDVLSSDLETFWAMDDRFNREFPYFPFPADPARRGLGIQVDGRAFQWSNALAENTIFFVYTITNVSPKSLDTVLFGIYGDPDLGGGDPQNGDDNGLFIPPYDSTGEFNDVPVYSRSLVYFWDPDMIGARSLPLGFIGCKFLESPGNPADGIDNDGDGMVDERQDDGLDNDHDWNLNTDDVGIDGIPNSADQGEGNGVPDAGLRLADGSQDPLHPGEPNFELTDLDEADQIGLTSFNSWTWSTANKISDDEMVWSRCVPRNFGEIQQASDLTFVFGSGYISLAAGETKRISMALALAWNLDALLTTAKTVQTIYNKNYQFFRPPVTPHVTAIPGDKKVTLYWDTQAEASIDPLTGKDFEGYVIYRSTDPAFNDIQTVTDGKGTGFLSTPLKDAAGKEAKFDVAQRGEPFTDSNGNGKYDLGEPFQDVNKSNTWDLVDDIWKGYSPVEYEDRGIHYYLGNNTGLVHSYVDSNNVINGQTYFYAVVSYDHGDSLLIPPTESTKKITVDPVTSQYKLDVNTAMVVPGPRANGYISPVIAPSNVFHEKGIATGTVAFSVLDDRAIREGGQYRVTFADSFFVDGLKGTGKSYSVLDLLPVSETFAPYDTNYTALGHAHISIDSVLRVTGSDGKVYVRNVDYVLLPDRGSIRRTASTSMPRSATFTITYRYYPVSLSTALESEDSNPVFDGVHLRLEDHPVLGYDPGRSSWIAGNPGFDYAVNLVTVGQRKRTWPADYEIRFSSSQYIDSAMFLVGSKLTKFPVRYSVTDVTLGTPQPILTYMIEAPATRDTQWTPGEDIVFFKPGSRGLTSDTLTWSVKIAKPADSTKVTHVPGEGDRLFIATRRPFTTADSYTLTTTGPRVDNALAGSRMDRIYVVPNPYVGLSSIEPTTRLPGANRGERRIYFENLPSLCTIRIYTINGDLVRTLEHDAGMENAREYWNLLNREGFSVAYGVYIAHVDAPGVGEKIVKFALIK
jgi:hypothetical protein